MLFQRINRGNPERIFVVVKNDYSTAAITNGQSVIWNFPATTPDGVGVTRPTARATNAGVAAAGVVAEASIAAAAYGLVQVYGYHAAVRVRAMTGGTPAVAKGRPLALNAAGSVFAAESFATASTTIQVFPFAVSLGANTVWTTAAIPAFVKAL